MLNGNVRASPAETLHSPRSATRDRRITISRSTIVSKVGRDPRILAEDLSPCNIQRYVARAGTDRRDCDDCVIMIHARLMSALRDIDRTRRRARPASGRERGAMTLGDTATLRQRRMKRLERNKLSTVADVRVVDRLRERAYVVASCDRPGGTLAEPSVFVDPLPRMNTGAATNRIETH